MSINSANIRTKSNAHYTCRECGSTENTQAHHQIPNDDNSLICLCAICHSKKHLNVPVKLFMSKVHQPYWNNVSASTLAKEVGVHPRTICRRANKFNIPFGCDITEENKKLLISKYIFNKEILNSIIYLRINDDSYFLLKKEADEKQIPLTVLCGWILKYHKEIINNFESSWR